MRRLLLTSAAVAAVLVLAGCSASGSSSAGPADLAVPAPAPAMPDSGAKSETAAGSGSSSGIAADAGQSVITTGTISLTVDDPAAATEQAVALVTGLDGRVDSRSQQAGGEGRPASAQLTVRIPAAKLDQAVESLKGLGTVESVSLDSSDVTLQVKDLDAQITALQASVDRLLTLVGQASTTADLIQLETAISDRQGQLDSLKSQRQYLADQVDYSTITLELRPAGALPNDVPGDFWSGLATGWASLGVALSGFVVVVGVLIPWLLPLAVIAVVVLLIVWLSRRPGRRGPPSAPAAAAAPRAPGEE